MIALACIDPPDGLSRGTLRLLADELVSLNDIEFDSIAHETVRKTLKNEFHPHRQKQWVIPPEDDAKFVYQMEDVLALYHEPYDPDRPGIVQSRWFRYDPNAWSQFSTVAGVACRK